MACRCEPIAEERYYELFCGINESLNNCIKKYPGANPINLNMFLEVDFKFFDRREKERKITKRIRGFGEIAHKYNRCKEASGLSDEDLWRSPEEAGVGGRGIRCDKIEPDTTNTNQFPACRSWANAVVEKMTEIYHTIENSRQIQNCRLNQGDQPPPPITMRLNCLGEKLPVPLPGQPPGNNNQADPIPQAQ